MNSKYFFCLVINFFSCYIINAQTVYSIDESRNAWLFSLDNKKQFFISPDNLYVKGAQLNIYGFSNNMQVSTPGNEDSLFIKNKYFRQQSSTGLFTSYFFSKEKKELTPEYTHLKALADVQWLKTSVKEVNSYNLLYHKLFLKEFSLNNSAGIKSAKMILGTAAYCRLQINDVWMQNQIIDSDKLNTIDIIGYVKKGGNKLLLDFSFEDGSKAFAAGIVVEYFNDDEIEFSSDQSWLTSEEYTFLSELSDYKMNFKAPEIVAVTAFNKEYLFPSEWLINVPCNYMDGLNNLYLSLDYMGNKARYYKNYTLADDNFNSNVSWDINLKKFGATLECQQLKLEIFPLAKQDRILFDIQPVPQTIGETAIKSIRFIPEYKIICDVK